MPKDRQITMNITTLTQADVDRIFQGYSAIAGWGHTKLKIDVEPDGHLKFRIYPNGDHFPLRQEKILQRLGEWAKRLNNEKRI